jgi:hypothetical protein
MSDHLRGKPQSALALPTGTTPLGLYAPSLTVIELCVPAERQ